VIRRALRLWTNPGDRVLDPFSGIASSGVAALGLGRRYVGIELKSSYFRQGVANMARAVAEAKRPTLFDLAAAGG
jgi:DNA modification methylase